MWRSIKRKGSWFIDSEIKLVYVWRCSAAVSRAKKICIGGVLGGLTSCQNRLLTKCVSAKLDVFYVANWRLFMCLSCHNTALMLLLVLGTTTTRLAVRKHRALALNAFFIHRDPWSRWFEHWRWPWNASCWRHKMSLLKNNHWYDSSCSQPCWHVVILQTSFWDYQTEEPFVYQTDARGVSRASQYEGRWLRCRSEDMLGWHTGCVPIQGPHPSGANYVTTPRKGCPNPKAPPNAAFFPWTF